MTQDSSLQPSARVQRTRQRILQAATHEFAVRGYAGATTRAIASAAGVSELTLFRHFGAKKNLFTAVVAQNSPASGLQVNLAERLSGNLRDDLILIGGDFLSTLTARREVILMTLREAEEIPAASAVQDVVAQLPRRQREMLAGYLHSQMESGKLRLMDADWLAQAFLGMFFAYAIRSALIGESPVLPAQEVVDFFVDLFLKGAAA